MSPRASIHSLRNGSRPTTGSLPGPAVRYTWNGALASPLGDGSRAISVTGTRIPVSASSRNARECDLRDWVTSWSDPFWVGLSCVSLVLKGLLTSFAGITRTGSTVAGCISPISALARAPVWS
ncbi:hypothetical protein AHiyo8_58570 [Arthrobacter sp. Hiyo8]|nr:hypothetical protein AHiyo8_58570 [Arthrobacter sp. Hiyo8]